MKMMAKLIDDPTHAHKNPSENNNYNGEYNF